VNGAPKLADIGLVTDVGEAKSFVGTEGFIPPEGPGTAQADIYSLGKVLYEIATGKDRQSFPEPPTLLEQFTDRKQLLELNEIILKACENDPRKRYRSAEEMHEELQLLQFGKSVKRLRLVERRLVRARNVGLAAAGVAVLAILTVCLFAYRARIERDSRKRVEQALNRAEAAEQVARRESYANAMLLGHEALQENNFGLVRDLLDQTRSFASDAGTTNDAQSIPAWEWRHLQYETRDEAAYVFAQCASKVHALDASPDGQWLAAGLKTGHVSLWRPPAREPIGEWQTGRDVLRVAFSPDSRRLAVGCIDGMVRVLAIPSGEVIAEFHDTRERILDLRFSPDGARLAYCSPDVFTITDPGAKHIEQSARYEQGAWRGAISPDFQLVARALVPEGLAFYRDGTNVVFRGVVGDRFHGNGRSISPDGRWFVMPLADHSIEIWSVSELRPIRRLVGHTGSVDPLAWSVDSRLLFTGGQDQVVAVWNVEQGRLIRRLQGHQNDITVAALSPDSRVLYSGSRDKTIRVWTSVESDPVPDRVALPPETWRARLAPGAHFVYAESTRVGLRIFATHPAPRICHTANLGGSRIWGVSPDGKTVVGADPQSDLCEVWRRETSGFFVLRSAHQALKSLRGVPTFSGDGRRVAFLGADGSFGVWDVEPWRHVASWQGAEPNESGITFDPPGKRVFVGCPNKGVLVGDIETGRIFRMPTPDKAPISHVAISPDNRLVATSDWSESVILWAFAPGEDPRRLATLTDKRLSAWSVAFSPDGRRLALGMSNGEIRLWDIEHNKQVGVLKGHKQPVWELGFSPDDDSLVSVSPDELRIWRVTAPSTNIVELSSADGVAVPHSEGIALPPGTLKARLAPGAGFLCTADPGGIRIFDTDARRQTYDSERIAGTLCGISPDGQWIAVAYPWGGICEVWRHRSNNQFVLPDLPDLPHETNGCYKRHRQYHVLVKRDETYQVAQNMAGVPAFSQDGRRVALLAADGTFGVWEVEPVAARCELGGSRTK